MKKPVYPIILTPIKNGGFCVTIPDMGNHTEGEDLADAIAMAKDAIEMMGVFLQDEGKPVPAPSDIDSVKTELGEIKTLVPVDFDAYRRATENKVVRKAVTIPSWLNVKAEAAGVNFSATLQDALRSKLGVEA